MTHEVHTRPLPPAAAQAPAAAAGPSAMDRVDRALEGLWHFLSSMRVAMVIMLAIAALGVVGSLLIQAPPGVIADPARRRPTGWTASGRATAAGRTSSTASSCSRSSTPSCSGSWWRR